MREKKFTTYLKVLFLVILGGLLLVVLTNVFIDPYGVFGMPRIDGLTAIKSEIDTHTRLAKAFAVDQIKPVAVCLGNSRSEYAIDPEHPGWTGVPVYNLGIPGSNMYERLRFLEHAESIQHLDQVVLVLEMLSFDVSGDNAPDFNENILAVNEAGKTNPLYRLNGYLNAALTWDGLLSSVKTLVTQSEQFRYYLDNGMKTYDEVYLEAGQHKVFTGTAKSYMDTYRVPGSFVTEDPDTGFSNFEVFRTIVRFAYQHDIDLRIAISPNHVYLWETFATVGLLDDFEDFKKIMVQINEEEAELSGDSPFPLWDFSGYSEFTEEPVPAVADTEARMKWYWELSHYKSELGDVMLDRIFGIDSTGIITDDFGVLMTSGNIEEYIRQLRIDRQKYRETHPEVVAEIEELARQAGVANLPE